MKTLKSIEILPTLANQKEAMGAGSTAFGVKPRNWMSRGLQLLAKGKESFSSQLHRRLRLNLLITVFISNTKPG